MKNTKIFCALAVLASVAYAPSARAQALADTTLHTGTRIRIQAPYLGAKPRIGNFVSLIADTLSFTLESETVPTRLPIAQVTELDVSTGTTSNRPALQKKMRVAEIIGAVAGAAIGNAAGSSSNGARVLLGVVGGLGGFLAGHEYAKITGSASADVWQPVALRARGR